MTSSSCAPVVRTPVREQLFAVNQNVRSLSTAAETYRCLTSPAERPYDDRHVAAEAHPPPASGADVHRTADPRPWLPAVGARDRRGGRPHLTVDGAQPPAHAAERSATCAATRPSRGPSRCAGIPTRGRSWSAARCATCPSSATSPPAPTCSPRRTSRSCIPLPADFTGEGDLFMLRVRGESMIEAGILDGDYVVAEQGDRRRTPTTSSSPGSPAARRPSSAIAATDRRHPHARRTRRWSRWSSTPPTCSSTARSSPCMRRLCSRSGSRRHASTPEALRPTSSMRSSGWTTATRTNRSLTAP